MSYRVLAIDVLQRGLKINGEIGNHHEYYFADGEVAVENINFFKMRMWRSYA